MKIVSTAHCHQATRDLMHLGDSLVVRAKLVSARSGRVLDRDKAFVDARFDPFPRRPR